MSKKLYSDKQVDRIFVLLDQIPLSHFNTVFHQNFYNKIPYEQYLKLTRQFNRDYKNMIKSLAGLGHNQIMKIHNIKSNIIKKYMDKYIPYIEEV
jgi:hypothetical protein